MKPCFERIKMQLPLEEQQSYVAWNEWEKVTEVSTFSPRWHKCLEEKLGLKPTDIIQYDNCVLKFYKLPKARLPLPTPKRQVSEKERQRLADLGKKTLGTNARKLATRPKSQRNASTRP